jgi:hypothetical protein
LKPLRGGRIRMRWASCRDDNMGCSREEDYLLLIHFGFMLKESERDAIGLSRRQSETYAVL